MTTQELESRLTVLERMVAELERRVAGNGSSASLDPRTMDPKTQPQWWVEGAGRFRDDPDFDDMVRIMRENREKELARFDKRQRKSKSKKSKANS